jgi:anthranilate phosphoribosyltransferase
MIAQALSRVSQKQSLSADEMAEAIGAIIDGKATPSQVGALLIALKMKGETVDELCGAARAMRSRARALTVPSGVVVDTCGTGGDGLGTFNISTVAALVVAAAGVKVCKHGNRAVSSSSGSADLLEALGVNISPTVQVVERCLSDLGFAFCFAPHFHPATRAVAEVRRELGVRTLFNLLGPLTNPARVRHQVVGVYAREWVEPLCRVLAGLGAEHVWVVHGDGLDELCPSGNSEVAEWKAGQLSRRSIAPADFGLLPGDRQALRGGSAAENAVRARAVLDGEKGTLRDAVLMSAAAALHVAGEARLDAALARAAAAVDDGRARELLARLIEVTRS